LNPATVDCNEYDNLSFVDGVRILFKNNPDSAIGKLILADDLGYIPPSEEQVLSQQYKQETQSMRGENGVYQFHLEESRVGVSTVQEYRQVSFLDTMLQHSVYYYAE
jgi:hypothetical protein